LNKILNFNAYRGFDEQRKRTGSPIILADRNNRQISFLINDLKNRKEIIRGFIENTKRKTDLKKKLTPA
jgi:NRPS condensation-like uncharacterized protein